MKSEDQFEKRLQRQALRPVPPGWREEILSTARNAKTHALAVSNETSACSSLKRMISSLLWPHPKAWAGLVAIWLLILGLNFATREPSGPQVVARAAPPSPQVRELLRQQEQLLAELSGPFEQPEANRPKPALPPPRSQRREQFANA